MPQSKAYVRQDKQAQKLAKATKDEKARRQREERFEKEEKRRETLKQVRVIVEAEKQRAAETEKQQAETIHQLNTKLQQVDVTKLGKVMRAWGLERDHAVAKARRARLGFGSTGQLVSKAGVEKMLLMIMEMTPDNADEVQRALTKYQVAFEKIFYGKKSERFFDKKEHMIGDADRANMAEPDLLPDIQKRYIGFMIKNVALLKRGSLDIVGKESSELEQSLKQMQPTLEALQKTGIGVSFKLMLRSFGKLFGQNWFSDAEQYDYSKNQQIILAAVDQAIGRLTKIARAVPHHLPIRPDSPSLAQTPTLQQHAI